MVLLPGIPNSVEHVMDGGTTEGTSEFVAVTRLSEGYDGVGDGCTDVCTHDDEDGRRYR